MHQKFANLLYEYRKNIDLIKQLNGWFEYTEEYLDEIRRNTIPLKNDSYTATHTVLQFSKKIFEQPKPGILVFGCDDKTCAFLLEALKYKNDYDICYYIPKNSDYIATDMMKELEVFGLYPFSYFSKFQSYQLDFSDDETIDNIWELVSEIFLHKDIDLIYFNFDMLFNYSNETGIPFSFEEDVLVNVINSRISKSGNRSQFTVILDGEICKKIDINNVSKRISVENCVTFIDNNHLTTSSKLLLLDTINDPKLDETRNFSFIGDSEELIYFAKYFETYFPAHLPNINRFYCGDFDFIKNNNFKDTSFFDSFEELFETCKFGNGKQIFYIGFKDLAKSVALAKKINSILPWAVVKVFSNDCLANACFKVFQEYPCPHLEFINLYSSLLRTIISKDYVVVARAIYKSILDIKTQSFFFLTFYNYFNSEFEIFFDGDLQLFDETIFSSCFKYYADYVRNRYFLNDEANAKIYKNTAKLMVKYHFPAFFYRCFLRKIKFYKNVMDIEIIVKENKIIFDENKKLNVKKLKRRKKMLLYNPITMWLFDNEFINDLLYYGPLIRLNLLMYFSYQDQ